jgi:hypothetical protein
MSSKGCFVSYPTGNPNDQDSGIKLESIPWNILGDTPTFDLPWYLRVSYAVFHGEVQKPGMLGKLSGNQGCWANLGEIVLDRISRYIAASINFISELLNASKGTLDFNMHCFIFTIQDDESIQLRRNLAYRSLLWVD